MRNAHVVLLMLLFFTPGTPERVHSGSPPEPRNNHSRATCLTGRPTHRRRSAGTPGKCLNAGTDSTATARVPRASLGDRPIVAGAPARRKFLNAGTDSTATK